MADEGLAPLQQLFAWWRLSALLKFGRQLVGGLLERCRAAGAAIRVGHIKCRKSSDQLMSWLA
ncbi:hypothetical protein ABZS83_02275 [Streptomyces sp. NPDC005426]|uniref:hypothetical protein n=1 Tax=Streptomyces sp. NPDC005426 TaxID=3155344 RepID=UPI0033BDA27D